MSDRRYQEEKEKSARQMADLQVFKDNDPEEITKTRE